jgi:hypothetical protein
MEPTLDEALASVFGSAAGGATGTGSTGNSGGSSTAGGEAIPARVRRLVASASSEYAAAEKALAKGNLGEYQSDVEQAGTDLNAAQKLLQAPSTSTKKVPAKATTADTTSSLRASRPTRPDAGGQQVAAVIGGPAVPQLTRDHPGSASV